MSVCIIKRDSKPIGIAESDSNGIAVLKWFHENCPAYSADHALKHEGYSVETLDSVDCHGVESLIGAICQRRGITMDSVFVPFSKARNAKPRPGSDKPWRSLNWRVTLKDSGGRVILESDYAQGEGHAPAYKLSAKEMGGRDSVMRHDAITHEIETGRVYVRPFSGTSKQIPAPSIGDVLQSLAMDSDAIDAGTFEEWASNYGYDTDSRSAESVYRACLESALSLRRGLGESLLTEIRLAASFN